VLIVRLAYKEGNNRLNLNNRQTYPFGFVQNYLVALGLMGQEGLQNWSGFWAAGMA
jgi:hypothetical protein